MSDDKYPRVKIDGVGGDKNGVTNLDVWPPLTRIEVGDECLLVPVDALVIERDADGEWPAIPNPWREPPTPEGRPVPIWESIQQDLDESWDDTFRQVLDALEAASKESER